MFACSNLLLKDLGNIKLNSKVVLIDPCYDYNGDNKLAVTLNNVLEGEYQCFCVLNLSKENNISHLIVVNKEYFKKNQTKDILKVANYPFSLLCVDSGQIGIFNKDYLREINLTQKTKNVWYSRICDLTLRKEENPLNISAEQYELKTKMDYMDEILDFCEKYNLNKNIIFDYTLVDFILPQDRRRIATIKLSNENKDWFHNLSDFELLEKIESTIHKIENDKMLLSETYVKNLEDSIRIKLKDIREKQFKRVKKDILKEYLNSEYSKYHIYKKSAGTIDMNGVVSNVSGDTNYPICLIKEDNNKVVCIEIDFGNLDTDFYVFAN